MENFVRINGGRLIRNLNELAQFGQNEDGGIDRVVASEADAEARKWIIKTWQDATGLTARIDPIANIWMESAGTEDLSPIVIGSHHDAVPDGGKYDGAMGVMIAGEIMQTVIENGIRTRHPIGIVSFTGEEPNPFRLSTIGSKVVSGRLRYEDLKKAANRETGESLENAIARLGGDISRAEDARIYPGQVAAFLEAHNELGRQLDAADEALGSVGIITGIYREEISFHGEANHAGTTQMCDRHDAAAAMSEMILAVERAAAEFSRPDVTATVGYVKIMPNEANIIAGEAKLMVDIRTSEDSALSAILQKIAEAARKTAESRGIGIERTVLLHQEAKRLDDTVVNVIEGSVPDMKPQFRHMVSMAGHDAENMSLLTRAGMLFVRSIGGKGHCRQEYSREEDIIKAADVMLEAVLKLDKELG